MTHRPLPPPPVGAGLVTADDHQLILTIHPPMDLGRFIALQKAVSRIWPAAVVRNGSDGYEVLVPKGTA